MIREAEKQTAFSFKLAGFAAAGGRSERCDKNITKGFALVRWRRATLQSDGGVLFATLYTPRVCDPGYGRGPAEIRRIRERFCRPTLAIGAAGAGEPAARI